MVNEKPRRVTDVLIADHDRLHALIHTAMTEPVFNTEAFAEFRVGLLRHIGIEERILFPAVTQARGGEPLSRALALRIDHAALSTLLVPTPDAALCAEILLILTPHDAKEEGDDGVYAECEALLSAEESAALADRAAATPSPRCSAHYDGDNIPRTAAGAMEKASYITVAQRLREEADPH